MYSREVPSPGEIRGGKKSFWVGAAAVAAAALYVIFRSLRNTSSIGYQMWVARIVASLSVLIVGFGLLYTGIKLYRDSVDLAKVLFFILSIVAWLGSVTIVVCWGPIVPLQYPLYIIAISSMWFSRRWRYQQIQLMSYILLYLSAAVNVVPLCGTGLPPLDVSNRVVTSFLMIAISLWLLYISFKVRISTLLEDEAVLDLTIFGASSYLLMHTLKNSLIGIRHQLEPCMKRVKELKQLVLTIDLLFDRGSPRTASGYLKDLLRVVGDLASKRRVALSSKVAKIGARLGYRQRLVLVGIVHNLLYNAILASPVKGRVSLKASSEQDRLQLSVCNKGTCPTFWDSYGKRLLRGLFVSDVLLSIEGKGRLAHSCNKNRIYSELTLNLKKDDK